MRGKWRAQRADGGAHAARGFVGGAAFAEQITHLGGSAFQCRTRLCGWCSKHSMPLPSALTRFQCRTRLCGWCSRWGLDGSLLCSAVSMPHAAIPFRPHHRFAVPLPRSRRGGFSFTVCRLLSPMRGTRAAAKYRRSVKGLRYFSFPRRCGGSGERSEPMGALMPHAALWVVQLLPSRLHISAVPRFNAARGFVGGAASTLCRFRAL